MEGQGSKYFPFYDIIDALNIVSSPLKGREGVAGIQTGHVNGGNFSFNVLW